jgi:hypothetical protein
MNENLSDMVKDETKTDEPIVFSEADLDLPTQEQEAEEVVEEPQAEAIGITTLNAWFDVNCENFSNINQVKVSIRGVNPSENLIMAVEDENSEADAAGERKRKLRVFDNADIQPVLNLPGIEMQIYNNGFKSICEYGDNIYIKCYGIRTSLVVVFCNNINGILIPYNITKVRRTDTEVVVPRRPAAEVEAKLSAQTSIEDLQLRYKQASKAEDITTNLSSVTWLLSRQAGIEDVNHHLQIDNVIIETLE